MLALWMYCIIYNFKVLVIIQFAVKYILSVDVYTNYTQHT